MEINVITSHTIDRPGRSPRVIALGYLSPDTDSPQYPFTWVQLSATETTLKVSCTGLTYRITAQRIEDKWTVTAAVSYGEKSVSFPSSPLPAVGDVSQRLAAEFAEAMAMDWVPNDYETHRFIDFCINDCSKLVALAFATAVKDGQCE